MSDSSSIALSILSVSTWPGSSSLKWTSAVFSAPKSAEGLAAHAVEAGSRGESLIAGAAGPETFTFEELLRLLASAVGARVRLVHTPPSLGFALTRLIGLLLRDVVLTRDEVDGLIAGLLTTTGTPSGKTRLSEWLDGNSDSLGRRDVSELRRNFRR